MMYVDGSWSKYCFVDSPNIKVIIRDGYTCVLTGYKDLAHPALDESDPGLFLQAAHILRRSIGKYNDHTSDFVGHLSIQSISYRLSDFLYFFTSSFNLPLRRSTYSEILPAFRLRNSRILHGNLDDPSNGMMLQSDAHAAFNKFHWCLKKQWSGFLQLPSYCQRRIQTDDVCALKVFKTIGLLRRPENNLVTFRDHSDDFNSDSSRKRKRPVSLPNPDYIAIHTTIAGVLNMSGAGRFFDELLDKYKDDEGEVPLYDPGQSLRK